MKRRSVINLVPSMAIFISGYIPLFLIMAIKDIQQLVWFIYPLAQPVWGVANINIPYWLDFKNGCIVVVLFVLSLLSYVILNYVLNNLSNSPNRITINQAKSRSSEVVNYTIPYMISFVAFDLSKWQDLVSLMLFLSILCLLSIRSQSIFINPILAAKGYGLYDCSFTENGIGKECVLLSKHDLTRGSDERYKKLNNYMGFVSD